MTWSSRSRSAAFIEPPIVALPDHILGLCPRISPAARYVRQVGVRGVREDDHISIVIAEKFNVLGCVLHVNIGFNCLLVRMKQRSQYGMA